MRITRKVFSIYSESDLIDEISERAFCQGYLAAEEEERIFAKIKDQKKQANRIAKLEKERIAAEELKRQQQIQQEAAKKADSVLGSLVPKPERPVYSDIQAPLADPRQTEVLRAKQEAIEKAKQEAAAKAQQEAAALKSQEEKAGKSILGKVKELASSKAGKIGLGTAGAAGLGYSIYKYKNRNND